MPPLSLSLSLAAAMAPAPVLMAAGTGKVTDSQVAFMVECYLRDSQFTRTLTEFRSEAARLLHPLRTVPSKGARSLGSVLNDYVTLKEEQISAVAERARVEDLFHGLQDILAVYLSGVPNKDGGQSIKANSLSMPPLVSPCGTQQSQLQVPCQSDGLGKASSPKDQQDMKEKKRKSQAAVMAPKCINQLVQQVDTPDLVKKPRCTTFERSCPTAEGSLVIENVPFAGDESLLGSKMVQPTTPPMNSVSIKSQQHSSTIDHLVSPKQTRILPLSATTNVVQHHQDPCTPPPSMTSPLNVNSTMCAPSTSEATMKPMMESRKHGSMQHRRKTQIQSTAPATCHYALRAHKKLPDTSCVPASDAQSASVCNSKPLRKKAGNMKCRLLDFSNAATNSSPEDLPMMTSTVNVLPSNCASTPSHSNGRNVHEASSPPNYANPSSGCEQLVVSQALSIPNCHTLSMPLQKLVTPAVVSLSVLQHGHSSAKQEHASELSVSSASQESQESQTIDFTLSDTFSFDELFNLDLDTNLISELEDLAGLDNDNMDNALCLKTGEKSALPCAAESLNRAALMEINNVIHSEDAAALVQKGCPLASPSKQKPAGGDMSMDKENVLALKVSTV